MMSGERVGKPVPAPKLDDLMLAMDVVDTLRHEQNFLSNANSTNQVGIRC